MTWSIECCEAVDADRDARAVLALGRPDGQALDVEAAAREQARDAREHARASSRPARERVVGVSIAPSDALLDPGVVVLIQAASIMSRRGGAGGHHRVDLLLVVDAEVDHGAAVATRARRQDRDVDLLLGLGPEADARRTPRRASRSRGSLRSRCVCGVALVVEQLLPLAHHAEPAVVDDARR